MDYSYLKLIHVFSVMIFLGNIITGLFWMRIAVKTKDLKIITFTMKGIRDGDRYFTIPGVLVITAFGFFCGHFGTLSNFAYRMDTLVYHYVFNFWTCFCIQSSTFTKENLSSDIKQRIFKRF